MLVSNRKIWSQWNNWMEDRHKCLTVHTCLWNWIHQFISKAMFLTKQNVIMFQPKHTYVEISFIISNRKSYQNAIKGKTDESGHSIYNKLHVRPAKTRISLPIHAVFTTCLKTFSILDYPQNALWRLWLCRLVENAVPLLWHKRFIIWDHLQTLILKS